MSLNQKIDNFFDEISDENLEALLRQADFEFLNQHGWDVFDPSEVDADASYVISGSMVTAHAASEGIKPKSDLFSTSFSIDSFMSTDSNAGTFENMALAA